METLTLDWGRGWLARLFGRNHLVRGSDRLETAVAACAVIVMIAAIPIAVAFGSAVKDSQSSLYTLEAQTRHQTTATAVETGLPHLQVYTQSFRVRARWVGDGGLHEGNATTEEMVRAGDRFTIWIDKHGNVTTAPTPVSAATNDAVALAVICWAVMGMVMAAAVYGLHWWLERARYTEWDHDLDCLIGNDGGRANRE